MSEGRLMLPFNGIEFQSIHRKYRDCALNTLLDLSEHALSTNEDDILLDKRIEGHKYSFGDFYDDFLYPDWVKFHSNSILKDISLTTYQRLIASQFYQPGKSLSSQKEFNHLKLRKVYFGLTKSIVKSNRFCIYTKEEFDHFKIEWYSNNPDFIDWTEDAFLPNRQFIEETLVEEIIKHGKKDSIANIQRVKDSRERLKQITVIFHNEVMKHIARGEIEGYAEEVGGKICLGNYYKFEPAISTKEHQLHDSLRKVYKILKNGIPQYISLDFEKGMFEFHDENGHHLGEFMYDGTINSAKQKADHDLTFI